GVGELRMVAPAEVVGPLRVVAVPAAQLRRRGELAGPALDVGAISGEPPGPEPVDQHPVPIAGLRLLVDALHLEAGSRRCGHGRMIAPAGGWAVRAVRYVRGLMRARRFRARERRRLP